MVAAFNPCGFALVPAYLAFFLGGEDGEDDGGDGQGGRPPPRLAPVARALAVGGSVTIGFVAVFGLAGLATTGFSLAVQRVAPWVSVPIGLALTALGVATVVGWKPALALPRLAAGGRRRGLASMTLYGASYATVSLSCTLPIFLAAVATTFRDASLLSGLAVFVAYALGMGTVLTALAVVMALAQQPLAAAFRRAVPFVTRAGGGLLVLAGAYVTWYAVYEIRLQNDDGTGEGIAAGPVVWVTRWSGQVSNWIDTVGSGRIALAALVLVALAAALQRLRARARSRPAAVGPGEPAP